MLTSSQRLKAKLNKVGFIKLVNNERRLIVLALAAVAAVLYNIWFLGYILDPGSLNNSYISVLEVPGKPHSSFFIATDILTGVIVIVIGLILWLNFPLRKSGVIGYTVFGLATLLDAIVPITSKCAVSVSACGISPSQIVSFHDLASLFAAGGIFTSLLSVIRLTSKDKKSTAYKWAIYSYRIWYVTGLLLILGVVTDDLATITQELFLIACGLALVTVPIGLFSSDRGYLKQAVPQLLT